MKHTHLVKSKKMLNHFTLIYIFATLLHCVCTLYSTVLYIYIIQYILVCFSYNINLVLFLLSVGISLPESRSRLYQGSRSRSDNFVCKSTPPLFQTPQPRIDEIDISPLPLTSDRRGWGFPPLEIDFFTPDWISSPLLPRIGWDWYSHPCQGNDILEVRNLEAFL